jgi:micrococcal nuclease
MYTYNAKVIKIIDGDTIDLEIDLGFHVKICKRARLSGIDAYEKKSTFIFERELAAKAMSFLVYRIENRTVKIKTAIDKEDKYGRILVEVYANEYDFLNNQSLNIMLIQENLAIPYGGGTKKL